MPSLLASFRPQVLVTQCGADTHAEDPLANLELSVDGHRAIYRALRELAEPTAEGRGWRSAAAGTGCSGSCRGRGRTCIATVLDRDLAAADGDPGRLDGAHRAASPTGRCPRDERRADTAHAAWGDGGGDRVDATVLETRRAVFPLHGLDPDDPRD